MALKWTINRNDTGILRKCGDIKEKKEELFVFGYSCKLFRDNEKALHIDQGKHLIPWMGDETLKIDRYDARGALHDLSSLEAPPGGYDWRVELTKGEWEVEQLCDEERYRALHTNEDEEEMYKEEELKRLHAAGYGQVGFNYDAQQEPGPVERQAEVEEPFEPTSSFRALLPADMVLPETLKQNAIIEKTSMFVANQGAQMEILIKAKQGDNPQFQFMNKDSTLHPYYTALIGLVKAGTWPEKKVESIEEKPHEPDEYLHPSLASTVIESAPCIPSIHYKPSADCDYTMLISKMRGDSAPEEVYASELAPGEVAPPGTEPLPPRPKTAAASPGSPAAPASPASVASTALYASVAHTAHIARPPMLYRAVAPADALPEPPSASTPPPQLPSRSSPSNTQTVKTNISTGLSLMSHYNTDSESEQSESDDSDDSKSPSTSAIVVPPVDVQVVIDKMAAYVARNGDDFADIVRAKNDPRFTFLEPSNVYHPYYKRLMQEKRGGEVNGAGKTANNKSTVSFSIKKQKEPDPILPKPALPYESSSEDESEGQEKQEEYKEQEPIKSTPSLYLIPHIPPAVVYKIENKDSDLIKVDKITPVPQPIIQPVKEVPMVVKDAEPKAVEELQVKSLSSEEKKTGKEESPKKEKRKHEEHKRKHENKESRRHEPDVKISKRYDTEPKESRRPDSESRDSKRHNSEAKEFRRTESEVKESRRIESELKDRKRYETEVREHKRSGSEIKESRRAERRETERKKDRDREREKRENSERHREGEREKKRRRVSRDLTKDKEDVESEVISLIDNPEDLIDLTGELSDTKAGPVSPAAASKQLERRRRAAEFLRRAGVDPAAAALPTNSLASAMVDTLESLRKKKVEEEEKRRKRERRRHRERYEYENGSHRKSKRRKYRSSEDDESDRDASKSKKRRRREEDEAEMEPSLDIDLTSTLKELRNSSPTKDLVQDIDEGTQHSLLKETSSGELTPKEGKKKREDREYSEGEWSSDSEQDSVSSLSGTAD
ncbi:hypothetical protein ACJJTC_018452 [Scirpophaga incertulas]